LSHVTRRRILSGVFACGVCISCSRVGARGTNWARPLRYLIGTDKPGDGKVGEIIEVSYDATRPPPHGLAIKYGNLFDERNSGEYAPYLRQRGDTAAQYNEGQIDPRGKGWAKNINEQIQLARAQGFAAIEWDNPDAYDVPHVIDAVSWAHAAGLMVVAKNPILVRRSPLPYVGHPAVFGAIVERGAGDPAQMDKLRIAAGKPDMPVWFVSFGRGKISAHALAIEARQYKNMWVSYSRKGEYESSEDIN
jgi:hypothetical protein